MPFTKRLFCLGALACAALGATAPKARATLALAIVESGGGPILIVDNGAFDTNLTTPGVISVNTASLNALLTRFQFSDLGAQSNAPVGVALSNTPATLSQTGTVLRTTVGTGNATIAITATDTGFFFPSGNPKSMDSGASYGYRFTKNTDNQKFQSYFNPSNLAFDTQIPSPLLTFVAPAGVGPFNGGGNALTTSLGSQGLPFSLTNWTLITMARSTNAATLRSDQFLGATTVTSVVPEPSSILLIGAGALSLGLCAVRRRKGA